MASDRDQWADKLSGENSGSWLAGFLADEDELDRRAMWRLGSWGVGTVAAVVVALFAYQSSVGWRRDQVASADLVRQSQQIQWIAKEGQNETRRLASAVETLNSDRDRLYARVTVLEQGLDSVTGSVARQGAAAAPAPSPAAPTAAPPAAVTSTPAAEAPTAELIGPPVPATSAASSATAATAAAQNTPPAAPVAKTAALAAAASSDRTSPVTALQPDSPAPSTSAPSQPNPARAEATNNASAAAIMAPATATAAPATATAAPATATAAAAPAAQTPLMPTKSILAPPDPAAAKLIEPDPSAATLPPLPPPQVITAAPGMTEPDPVETQAPAIAVRRTEFGVDLGSASSIDGLRALWRGLLKGRSNKALADLQPIIVVKERNNGLGMQLRLVAGPISDAAAAAKLCATLVDSSRACETTVFDGQRLALKNDAGGKADSGAATASPGRPAMMSTRSLRRRGGAAAPAASGASGAKIEDQLEQSPQQPSAPAAKSSSLSSFLGMR